MNSFVTSQLLCMECYERTITGLEKRQLLSVLSTEVVLVSLHQKRERAATLMQRAWLQFQLRVSKEYGTLVFVGSRLKKMCSTRCRRILEDPRSLKMKGHGPGRRT